VPDLDHLAMRASAVRIAIVLALGVALERGAIEAQEPSRRKPVSFAILEDYDKGEDLRGVEADFELFEELEIRTWRGSLGWDDYEPTRGGYDFTWLHQFAALAERHHIELRPYLGYTPAWAARARGADADVWNNPPARVDDWERFTKAIAGALARHRNVASFEIYNEENSKQWWDGDAEEYGRVLTRGVRGIRRAHATVPILFGGLVFPDAAWMTRVCSVTEAARAFSILPFHAYPETWTSTGVTVENYLGGLSAFIETADRACGRKPIWINETGFATVPGKTEREQANWWVRAVATFLASPRVEHIGVYEIKDLALDKPAIGDAPNYHLGITRTDRQKKLAFYTVDLLTDLLDVGTISVDDGDVQVTSEAGVGERHIHLFTRPDGNKVLFAWDRTASSSVAIHVPGIRSSVEYAFDGQPLDPDATASVLSHLTLSRGVPRIFKLMP
jgi:polysaccharide biosynthesis protein PslG